MTKKIVAIDLTRPFLHLEENLTNTVKNLNRSVWSAVEFTTDEDIFDTVGNYNLLKLQWAKNPAEVWEFYDATVMLHPHSLQNIDQEKYVLTYSRVNRVTDGLH